jgi:hypothetical protein
LSGALLSALGISKIYDSFGEAQALGAIDPIIGVQFRHLIFVLGVIESFIAVACFIIRRDNIVLILIAWISIAIAVYRTGLWLINWQQPCHCMGTLTDALHISPELADNIMKGVLAYLLIGSYGFLIHGWWQSRKHETVAN